MQYKSKIGHKIIRNPFEDYLNRNLRHQKRMSLVSFCFQTKSFYVRILKKRNYFMVYHSKYNKCFHKIGDDNIICSCYSKCSSFFG